MHPRRGTGPHGWARHGWPLWPLSLRYPWLTLLSSSSFLALDSPRSHGYRGHMDNFKHEQLQTTTPSHLTYDTATSSRVKSCGRRIVTTINWRICARIEASKQFWMAMRSHPLRILWPWLICQPNSVFFCGIVMNLPEIRMLGRGLGLGTRDPPLWPCPWQDVWPWMVLSKEGIILSSLFFLCMLPCHALRAGLHYGGEGLRSVKNAWPRHGYMRQMVDVPEKN
jgi:hypothetical protein